MRMFCEMSPASVNFPEIKSSQAKPVKVMKSCRFLHAISPLFKNSCFSDFDIDGILKVCSFAPRLINFMVKRKWFVHCGKVLGLNWILTRSRHARSGLIKSHVVNACIVLRQLKPFVSSALMEFAREEGRISAGNYYLLCVHFETFFSKYRF